MNSTIERARALYLAGDLPAPDSVPCVCGAPRADHSGKTAGGACKATGCARYRADRVVELAARAAAAAGSNLRQDLAAWDRMSRAKTASKGAPAVRPSELGTCDRIPWYRISPPEGFESAPTKRGPATMGSIIHEELQRRLLELYPWLMCGDRKGFELFLPGSERPSKYDLFCPITGLLTSIKTAGDWQWDQVGIRGADEKWWDTDHLYAWALGEKGYEVTTIRVLVVHRVDADKFESFEMAYDEERALRVLAEWQALSMRIELGIEPDRQRPGPSTDPICRNCFARNHCWNIPEAERLGRSPENLTLLGPDPEDRIVNELGLALIDAREKKKAATKVETELKTLLDGVELKAYDDVEPSYGTSVSKDVSGYVAAVERQWNLPEDQRPATPPTLVEKRKRTVSWGLLRKATREARAKETAALALEAAQEPQDLLTVSSERVGELLALPAPQEQEQEQAAS